MLIGLCGKKQQGKDTTARFIQEILSQNAISSEIHSFADPVYKAVSAATGYSISQLQTAKTNAEPDALYGVTVRTMLQTLGTEWARSHSPTWWLNRMDMTLSAATTSVVIIPDVRFRNEADYIRRRNGVLWKLDRLLSNNNNDNHASEAEVDLIRPDLTLFNTGDLDQLKDKVQTHVEVLIPAIRIRRSTSQDDQKQYARGIRN